MAQGALEAALGVTTQGGGVVVSSSGVGALVGAPAIAAGVAITGHGIGVAGSGAYNLSKGNGAALKQHMLGENGPKINGSKTIGRGEGWHVDIENPDPGGRPGQVHYQDGKNKYYFDHESSSFYEVNAGQRTYVSNSQNKQLLNNGNVMRSINKGLKILGEL